MVKEKEPEKVNEDVRFRYIGYEVYPEEAKKFWKDEEEEKKYIEEARKRKGGVSIDRDHSMVLASVFSKVDRIILMISSCLIMIGFFLPWFWLNLGDKTLVYSPSGYIGKLSLILSYSNWSGPLLAVFAWLVLLLMLSGFACGSLSLVAIMKKEKDEEKYQAELKRVLRLSFVPIILWVVLLMLSMLGIRTPFLSASGIKQLGENFNILTFLSISSYGIWLTFCCLIVNSFKSNDL